MPAVRLTARTLFLICSASSAWAFSFGAGSQAVSHWLHVLEENDTVIGFAHAFYYLGMAVSSIVVPWTSRRIAPTACVTLGMLLSSVTTAAFPWMESTWYWYAMRFCNGWAGAMCVVPLETIVSRDSPVERKTQNFAYYGVAITLGGALGIGAAPQFYDLGINSSFLIGAIAPALLASVFLVGMPGHPITDDERPVPLQWTRNVLSFGTAWCQGFLEGGMIAFLQLFLVWRGFSTEDAGLLMGITTVGVILFQIPISWLADRIGTRPVLLACYAVVSLGLLTIPLVADLHALALVLFAFGACTGAMYPLGLSMLGERIPSHGLARAYAWFLVIECVGSVVGAAAMGKARDQWDQSAMFLVGFASVMFVLLVWVLVQAFWRRPPSLPATG
jgi:MFS family permease